MTLERSLHIVGDAAILDRPKIALFCSVKCPGKLILDTYDLAKRFRHEGVLVISPFHSPMEQEGLRILLRSPNPVIWALARGVYRQIPYKPVDCRNAVAEGRLIMVTPFPDTVRHITAETATTRNGLVAGMADAVVVAHAAPAAKWKPSATTSSAKASPSTPSTTPPTPRVSPPGPSAWTPCRSLTSGAEGADSAAAGGHGIRATHQSARRRTPSATGTRQRQPANAGPLQVAFGRVTPHG